MTGADGRRLPMATATHTAMPKCARFDLEVVLRLLGEDCMRRREFITLLGGAAATPLWPLPAHAQQPAMPLVGYLNAGSPDTVAAARLRVLRQGLSEAGYVDGRNVTIELRAAGGRYDLLPGMAADLVRRQAAVIVTSGVPATAAVKAATATVPIVFQVGADPVALGLVASLNRPGGNVTGVATLGVALGPKHLELLHELVPAGTVMALLINPTNPSAETLPSELEGAARKLGLKLHILQAHGEGDFDTAFATLNRLGAGGLVISNEGLFIGRSEQLATLTIRHAVPAIHVVPDFTAAGGLMSYGGSTTESSHLVGAYTGRILKGEKPADLPVQQSTKVELTINLKTAKALGLTVPLALLTRADEVIE
jgi:putative ABC transport system substrate-binding protein